MTDTWHTLFRGGGVGKRSVEVLNWLKQNQLTQHKRILDYGCGKGGTMTWLRELMPRIDITGYDVGNPEFAQTPQGVYDAIYSIDVLEHTTKDTIQAILQQLYGWSVTKALWCLIIDTTPAKKQFRDGTNAHTLLQTPTMWADTVMKWLDIHEIRLLKEPDRRYGERVRVMLQGKCRTKIAQ